MASPVLHIKDAYYFEVPKVLWRSQRQSREDFPTWWIKLDADYQTWEAEQLMPALHEVFGENVPDEHTLLHKYEHWKHADHANFGKPFESFLETQPWFHDAVTAPVKPKAAADAKAQADYQQQLKAYEAGVKSAQQKAEAWQAARTKAVNFQAYLASPEHEWTKEKIAGYNKALDGKILIPQPFGATLRNAYEVESGIAISKFMVIELIVAILVVAMFSWLAGRVRQTHQPRGRMWNMLEVILLYFRDHVARPAIDSHDHGHDDHGASHPHEVGDEELHLGDVHLGEELDEALHGHHEEHEGDKFVPLLWTFFTFILGCNLFGLLPWAGSPTGAFGCTIGLALVTLATGVGCGMLRHGPVGFFMNQVPSMDLPFGLGYILKPMILAIELLGLMIKHLVLGIRLLANMVAGHLVILGIMGLAFSVEAASSMSTGMWSLTALIAVLGTTAFYMLELFVAFLQAYIFTFLSALFIGAAIHKH